MVVGAVRRATNVARSPVARVGFSLIFLAGYVVGGNLRVEGSEKYATPAAASADLRRTMLTDHGGPAVFSAFPAPIQEVLILLFARPAVWVGSLGIDTGYAIAGWAPVVVGQALGVAGVVGVMAYGMWHFATVAIRIGREVT
jgi:hypothetical protein